MSWNIENIGDAKIYPNLSGAIREKNHRRYICDYIAQVIINNEVDLLAIMEVVSNQGRNLALELLPLLGPDWHFAASSQQQTSRKPEQVLYLYRETRDIGLSVPDPPTLSQYRLLSIIDDHALVNLWATTAGLVNNVQYNINVYAALMHNGYIYRGINVDKVTDFSLIEDAYFVREEKWSELRAGRPLELTYYADAQLLIPALTDAQKAIIRDVLLNTSMVKFPAVDDRVPFLINQRVGDVPLLISTLHLPAPESDTTAYQKRDVLLPAIYNLTLCDIFRNTDHLLLMGDFNVSQDTNNRAQFQTYNIQSQVRSGIEYLSYQQGSIQTSTNFFSILERALNVTDVLGVESKTSLTTSYSIRKMTSFQDQDAARFEGDDYLVNPYDKFFFKSTGGLLATGDEEVINLVETINPEMHGAYNQEEARAATKYFKSKNLLSNIDTIKNVLEVLYRKKQRKIGEVKKQLHALQSLGISEKTIQKKRFTNLTIDEQRYYTNLDKYAELKNKLRELDQATVLTPMDGTGAFMVYRAISDHLPIAMTITDTP